MSEEFTNGDSILVDINGGEYPGLFIGYTHSTAFDDVALVQINGQRFSTYTNNIKKHPQEDIVNELEEYKKKVVAVITSLNQDETLSSEVAKEIARNLDLPDFEVVRWYDLNIYVRFRHDSVTPLSKEDVETMFNLPFDSEELEITLDKLAD